MDQNLPDFEQTQPAADAPKKPRRKPSRKIAKPKRALPKPARRVPKKRAKPAIKPAAPRLSVMFDACTRISNALQMLSPKEREAVLESVTASL